MEAFLRVSSMVQEQDFPRPIGLLYARLPNEILDGDKLSDVRLYLG